MIQLIKRIIVLIFCVLLLTSLTSSIVIAATDSAIDTSAANYGYVTIDYKEEVNLAKMKVGITFNNKTTYYNYQANQKLSYPFSNGNGIYTISLYKNIRGTKYKTIETATINVKLYNELSPYLVSTYDARFTKGDLVDTITKSICKNSITDKAKVNLIYNFVHKNIKYDYDFAKKISEKEITNHIPSPIATIKYNKGICYDIASLFAAMCKTQNIPCYIVKGYYNGVSHAWNNVYIDSHWYKIDAG